MTDSEDMEAAFCWLLNKIFGQIRPPSWHCRLCNHQQSNLDHQSDRITAIKRKDDKIVELFVVQLVVCKY